MPRFTITSDQTGVGAAPAEATAGDPAAYVLEMPRGSAAVGVAIPALGACFAGVLAVVALVHLSLGGFVIGGLVAAGAGLATRQGLRAASVPLLAAGPGGLYLSGLGMAPGARRAQVVPWPQLRKLVVCTALEPSAQVGRGPWRMPALALEANDPAPGTPALGATDLPEVAGMVAFVPGAVDLSAVDPATLAEFQREHPDVAAVLEGRGGASSSPTATRRLPYQALARPLEGVDRERLVGALARYAPHVQLVDGPDIDTRAQTVWVGRPSS